MNYYIHGIPGRLRLKSPIIKKNKVVAKEVEEMFESIKGINDVDVNLLTGSLLINYNPKMLKYNDIVELLEKKGYFDASRAITNDDYIKKTVSKVSEIAISIITTIV
ncbi:MAG: heavy-metal-associated domain-containing protein [Syntrophorhabdaceae bacterium]|nr:heavy-metal-associated domain-containing protein [Syntrophorhabdaceae bacterium]